LDPQKVKHHASKVPSEILDNRELNEALRVALPGNYNFEVHKTLWRIQTENAKHVALQLPEGLLIFAPEIAEILRHFGGCMVTILGDVTYGGCCIDDVTAKFIEADFLVHYGHSCLVPVDHVSVRCMYVFVDVLFDVYHFVESVKLNVPLRALPNIVESEEPQQPPAKRIALLGTIQYSRALHEACELLSEHFGSSNVIIPRESPLTSGEVLGCTSPTLITGDERDCEICIFVSDGRFHLESAMIQNPSVFFLQIRPVFEETLPRDLRPRRNAQ